MEPIGVVSSFLTKFLADKRRGAIAQLEAYQARYPGYEAAIEREYRYLQGETDAHGPIGDLPDGLEQFGPYRLLRELGRGGQGIVYLAEDVRDQRTVALAAASPVPRSRSCRQARSPLYL